MSWQAVAWAMRKGKDYELEPITRFVMLTLANYADPEGNDIFPSLGTLEADTGLSERTIRRHIKTLMSVRLLEYGDQEAVKRNPRIRADQRPKVYRFIFESRPGGGPDFESVGTMPSSEQRPDRESTRKAVDNSQRPDFESVTTGQTTGQRVHQTIKPKREPSEPPAGELDADALEAGRRLREEIRRRNAQRGTFASSEES